MNESLLLIPALLTGVLLGAFFFGGLWWTVQQGLTSEWPAVWFLSSLLVRTVVALGGFYLVSQGHWQRLAMCLVGFVIARFVIMTRIKRAMRDEGLRSQREVHRAH